MGKLTDSAMRPMQLGHLGIIAARGPGSRAFLQGQLSQQLNALDPARALLAGYHTPQGRVLAVLRLLPQGADDVLLVLPRELAAPIASRLAKFVLRAKTKIADESAQWQVQGHHDAATGRSAWADRHISMVSVADAPAPGSEDEIADGQATWRAGDILAGLPQVYAATSEQFVAQMLNLDCLGGIAFDKGCYTGQEIIARAHYRGRVKRRMQAFETMDPQPLAAGDRVRLPDGRSAQIVDAQRLANGLLHFLAVAPLPSAATAEIDSEAADASGETRSIAVQPLPLPYALPE